MIRAVEESDLAAWRDLWAAYLRFYRASVPGEVTLATFRRLVAGNDGVVGLVAEDSGRLVALANLVFHSSTFNGPARSLYDQVAHPTSLVVYER